VPLAWRGFFAAAALCFIIAAGDYVTPELVGGHERHDERPRDFDGLHEEVRTAMANSAKLAIATVAFARLVGTAAAFALSRRSSRLPDACKWHRR
jgi:ABC-type spermidine/putrescine transport system permease subunit I